MSHANQTGPCGVGVFLSPAGQRRVDFQADCGELFERLFVADGTEAATYLLGQQRIDLMIVDLERFDRGVDLAALGGLIRMRGAAPTLVICPFACAAWLPDLLACGRFDYAIGPVVGADLGQLVAHCLAAALAPSAPLPAHASAKTGELRALLELSSRMQRALNDVDDLNKVAEQLCVELCGFDGVIHAALFHLKEHGDLQLEAQHGDIALDLARLLHRSDKLLQSPLRHAFPGLLAACSGELAWFDAPEKAGDPELAIKLREVGVEMAIGVPILIGGVGAPRGALCMLFGQRRQFSADELRAFADLAQLAGFGLRMAEMSRDTELLMGRLTHMATTDALTGVANRRQGEDMLEQEARRARRYKTPLAVISFDIDHFKHINEQFGHPCGDSALRTVAMVAQDGLRGTDLLARLGGEEFIVVAPHTSAIDGLKLAEKIRAAVAATAIPGCDRLTVSLGVAQLGEGESADALMRRLAAALARAKRAGRNCVELAMQ